MAMQTLAGLAGLLLLLCAFFGIGIGILRALRVGVTPLDAIYAVAAGWGVLVTISVLAAYVGIPLRHVLWAGLVIGGGILAVGIWQGQDKPLLKCSGAALFSILPAVVSAASFASVQYDEFGHWLPSAFYLYVNDALPTAAFPNLQTGKQAYPIGIPYVSFAVSAIEGAWDDRAPKVLPLALAALFGPLMAGTFLGTDRPGVSATAVAALLLTLLNPFFDPRVAVTTYSDVPTAFLLAAMLYGLWRAGEKDGAARDWTVRASLTALALVQLRETSIVFVGAAALSVPLAAAAARRHDAAGLKRTCAIAVSFVVAPAAAFLVWQLHLGLQDVKPDMAARPLSEWNWWALGAVLASLLKERLVNNPLMGGAAASVALGLAIYGALGWHRIADGTKRLAVAVAVLAAAQIALLSFAYVAVFSEDEVGRAASAWRYASHLGILVILAAAHVVSRERLAPEAGPCARWLVPRPNSLLVIAGVAAVQLVFASRWRIDCVYPHVRPGYEALTSLFAKIPPEAPIAIVNTADRQLFGEAARLARVRATGDWRTRQALVVEGREVAPPGAYVIDLKGADPELFRNGQTTLHASLHRIYIASPAIDSITVATSCLAR